MRRSALLLSLALLLPVGLAGCSSSGNCSDFGSLPTAQARFDAAPVVVIATVRGTDRTVEQDGIYRIHRARIERVLKGSVSAAAIDVLAPSDQCTVSGRPVEYLDGDPLDHATRSVLYLDRSSGASARRLIAPGAVDSLPSGSPLPFSTAAPSPAPTP